MCVCVPVCMWAYCVCVPVCVRVFLCVRMCVPVHVWVLCVHDPLRVHMPPKCLHGWGGGAGLEPECVTSPAGVGGDAGPRGRDLQAGCPVPPGLSVLSWAPLP